MAEEARTHPQDDVARLHADVDRMRAEIGKAIVGHADLIDDVVVALACGGHVLLEGVPGLGKTLLVRTLGRVLDLSFSRIQFTPDLMPADILGTHVLVHDAAGGRSFQFQKGPLFANIVLADEINRATPKTQSALLEAMQEQRVTVAGAEHRLDQPFFVLATQNPIEMEGTYPLPEAQLDRFLFKLQVETPSLEDLRRIVDLTTGVPQAEPQTVLSAERIQALQRMVREVPASSQVRDYALLLTLATQPTKDGLEQIQRYVRHGAGPRGAQALLLAGKAQALLAGRFNVSFDDIRRVLFPALRHRLILNYEADADDVGADQLLAAILKEVPEPGR